MLSHQIGGTGQTIYNQYRFGLIPTEGQNFHRYQHLPTNIVQTDQRPLLFLENLHFDKLKFLKVRVPLLHKTHLSFEATTIRKKNWQTQIKQH